MKNKTLFVIKTRKKIPLFSLLTLTFKTATSESSITCSILLTYATLILSVLLIICVIVERKIAKLKIAVENSTGQSSVSLAEIHRELPSIRGY